MDAWCLARQWEAGYPEPRQTLHKNPVEPIKSLTFGVTLSHREIEVRVAQQLKSSKLQLQRQIFEAQRSPHGKDWQVLWVFTTFSPTSCWIFGESHAVRLWFFHSHSNLQPWSFFLQTWQAWMRIWKAERKEGWDTCLTSSGGARSKLVKRCGIRSVGRK